MNRLVQLFKKPKPVAERLEINFTGSVQVAIEFFYAMKFGQLPKEIQKHVKLDCIGVPNLYRIVENLGGRNLTSEKEKVREFILDVRGGHQILVQVRQKLDQGGSTWEVTRMRYPRMYRGEDFPRGGYSILLYTIIVNPHVQNGREYTVDDSGFEHSSY
jgi:hypothetical protein